MNIGRFSKYRYRMKIAPDISDIWCIKNSIFLLESFNAWFSSLTMSFIILSVKIDKKCFEVSTTIFLWSHISSRKLTDRSESVTHGCDKFVYNEMYYILYRTQYICFHFEDNMSGTWKGLYSQRGSHNYTHVCSSYLPKFARISCGFLFMYTVFKLGLAYCMNFLVSSN